MEKFSDNKLWVFALGAICFIISQPLLRIPLLNGLLSSTGFSLFYALHMISVGILIAFSAGIFEEGFRFLSKNFLLKPDKTKITQPIIFGLGHGLAEAVILLGPYISSMSASNLALAVLERVLAIILHIGLSVIVWNGFQLNKRWKYLLIAVFVHGITNSLIPILSNVRYAIALIESALFFIDVIIVFYIFKSRIYYKGEIQNEEIEI